MIGVDHMLNVTQFIQHKRALHLFHFLDVRFNSNSNHFLWGCLYQFDYFLVSWYRSFLLSWHRQTLLFKDCFDMNDWCISSPSGFSFKKMIILLNGLLKLRWFSEQKESIWSWKFVQLKLLVFATMFTFYLNFKHDTLGYKS